MTCERNDNVVLIQLYHPGAGWRAMRDDYDQVLLFRDREVAEMVIRRKFPNVSENLYRIVGG